MARIHIPHGRLQMLVSTGTFLFIVIYIWKWMSVVKVSYRQKVNNVGEAPIGDKLTGCSSGYLPNFPSVCGNGGCLKILSKPGEVKELKTMEEHRIRDLNSIPGWMDMLNVDVVYHLTRAQRHFGIYGSVGEIGIYAGRFSTVLGYWLDKEAGERLFVCDKNASVAIFEANMNKLGYSLYSVEDSTRIRSWRNSSVPLSKFQFLQMGLPAFRMFSIDGNHIRPYPFMDMILVSCIIMDGGIIAIDDFTNEVMDVERDISLFFHLYGRQHYLPLFLIHGKLYLVSRGWHRRYIEWMKNNSISDLLKLPRKRGFKFDTEFYYLE